MLEHAATDMGSARPSAVQELLAFLDLPSDSAAGVGLTVLRSSIQHKPDDMFPNQHIVLHHPSDPLCPPQRQWVDDAIGFCQSMKGPVHLIVGRRAPDDAIERASVRFGIDRATLSEFRDTSEVPNA